MKTADKFSSDMSEIFSLVQDLCGGPSIQNTLIMCLNGDMDCESDNVEDWIMKYTYSDSGMFSLLYDLANYDLISLYGKNVNVDCSNHPDIAELVKKYAKKETVIKVYNAIFE